MPGHRMAPGEHGDFFYKSRAGGRTTAYVFYRNHRGLRRRIEATASSRSGAKKMALAALDRALSVGGDGEYSARATLRIVAMDWLAELDEKVANGRRSPTTVAQYRHVLQKHVLPGLGESRLTELTVVRIDRFLQGLRWDVGYSVAKLARAVLSGVCGRAVRGEGMRSNPVRDASPLEAGRRPMARALTLEECVDWLSILDSDEYATRKDLPDLTRFLLGTGCRIRGSRGRPLGGPGSGVRSSPGAPNGGARAWTGLDRA